MCQDIIEAGADYLFLPHFVTYTVCKSAITLHYHTAVGWNHDCKNIVCSQEQNNSGGQNLTSEKRRFCFAQTSEYANEILTNRPTKKQHSCTFLNF